MSVSTQSIALILTVVFNMPGWRKVFASTFGVSPSTAERRCFGKASLPAEHLIELMARSAVAEARVLALVEAERARIAPEQIGVRRRVGPAPGAPERDGGAGGVPVAPHGAAAGLAAAARDVVRADRAGRGQDAEAVAS